MKLYSPETTTPIQYRHEAIFALLATLLFLVYAGATTLNHEMWRDELGAWLISRDSHSLVDVFHTSRYEGHPSLWFLLLWPVTRMTSNPDAMKLLNLTAMAGTVYLVARHVPAPRWIRLLCIFGYFPVYEYGAISRNYAIGIFALTAMCVLFPRRVEHPLLLGTVLFLAANTSLFACILVAAAVVMLTVDALQHPAKAHSTPLWGGIIIAIAGLTVSLLQIKPPADSGVLSDWKFSLFDPARSKQVLSVMMNAYLPLPAPVAGFWQNNFLETLPLYSEYAWLGALALLLVTILAMLRYPLALLYYLLGSQALLMLFYAKRIGYLRHHGFLFICFVTTLWLVRSMQPVLLARPWETVSRYAEGAITRMLPLLLIVQCLGGVLATTGEYRYTFSAAKQTASMIRSRGLEQLPLVADRDYTATAVLGYLGKPSAYFANGQSGSFPVWNLKRMLHFDVWELTDRLSRELNTPMVVLLDKKTAAYSPPPSSRQHGIQLLGCSDGEIEPSESFCVYLYDRSPTQ